MAPIVPRPLQDLYSEVISEDNESPRQRRRRREQFLVTREFVHACKAFLGALDVRPSDNALAVHKELPGELDLVPLEFCMLT
ncbi:MAG: hypothetical protein HYV62_12335, partial [Candidatus Rokubacteria bacterium]|nr:hypothetical protein [Candidatus Rokubacteria bacterium]